MWVFSKVGFVENHGCSVWYDTMGSIVATKMGRARTHPIFLATSTITISLRCRMVSHH